jgi:hypothetical protein
MVVQKETSEHLQIPPEFGIQPHPVVFPNVMDRLCISKEDPKGGTLVISLSWTSAEISCDTRCATIQDTYLD